MQDTDEFARELAAGMSDVGPIRLEWTGSDATVFVRANDNAGTQREFRFVQSLREIAEAITIDKEAWDSMWPGWSLSAASVAMFSVHVEEAIATALPETRILWLVKGGVVAVQE